MLRRFIRSTYLGRHEGGRRPAGKGNNVDTALCLFTCICSRKRAAIGTYLSVSTLRTFYSLCNIKPISINKSPERFYKISIFRFGNMGISLRNMSVSILSITLYSSRVPSLTTTAPRSRDRADTIMDLLRACGRIRHMPRSASSGRGLTGSSKGCTRASAYFLPWCQ